MKVAITGGTGFVGSHLLDRLHEDGHEVVLVARGAREPAFDARELEGTRFVAASVTDAAALRETFAGCDAVAHLAGINRERGAQTYERVHVAGTETVVEAAADAGVPRLALTSYLRARPGCGSGYLESKWRSEEILRGAAVDHTVCKPGLVYGRGDQLLTSLARSVATLPLFPRVGIGEQLHRPLAVDDLVTVLCAALAGDLENRTVPVVGPEPLSLATMVRRVGRAMDRRVLVVPAPVFAHRLGAWVQDRLLEDPIVPPAAVRMLAEGSTTPAPASVVSDLPADLEPTEPFDTASIGSRLPAVDRYGLGDLGVG